LEGEFFLGVQGAGSREQGCAAGHAGFAGLAG